MYQPTYEQKKEKYISVLNNHFGFHNIFPEVANISDEDFKKIIELYEQKASVGGKNPWRYLYFDELIIMQQALYEVVKENSRYNDITSKVERLFEQELNRRLQRPVRSYGEETDETYRASYAEMPEYAMTLADMCTRKMETAQKSFAESKEVVLPESSLSTYEEIRKDFITAGIQMPEESESIVQSTKTLITLRAEERDALIERERQQREIELINLQQEINRVENEKLEIEKRIKQISSETLGSLFSRQVSEKYPSEYQSFQQQKEQVKNHRSSYAQITDLKEKFNIVSQELRFYQGVLPVYENFYQRFEQMKTERKQAQVDEREQERIYNLIHKAENERLQRSRSLYTAWDLGNKTIPPEYQGMTYEQVEALLNQKETEERARQEAEAARNELIGKAIRKDLNVPEDYHLSQIQIQNLSQQFADYSNDELREFISGVKKQETTSEVKTEEVSQTATPNEQTQQKEKLINDILGAMLNAGEFHNSGLDINQKMSDMEVVKRKLETKPLEELEYILSVYTPHQGETMSSGGIKR